MIDITNSGVYKITNNVNGKFYIGSTSNIKRRFSEHKRRLSKDNNECRILQKSWKKYGEEAFTFNILLICKKSDLMMYEQRALDILKPELNILKNAYSTLGRRHSKETKEKMSRSKTGWKHSEETKKKFSERMKGHVHSPKTMEKLIQIAKKKGEIFSKLYKGRKASEETKRKMSEAHKKIWAERKALP